jgi:quinoprotein dehydrogenase-associated probable ABC transporter substrate-binding protein
MGSAAPKREQTFMQKTVLALLALIIGGLSGATATIAAEGNTADLVNRRVLRVCADPANMPFSNKDAQGFENKIAEIVADELKLKIEYRYLPQSLGFVRQTLAAKRCDLIVGTVQGEELVLNTNHYYRSTYALIYKPGTGLDGVTTLSDPKMKGKRVGIQIGAPSGDLVARAGLMGSARPYRLIVDRRFESPAEEMMADIRKGEIDAAVLWGPMAGYYATRGGDTLLVVPLIKDKDTRTEFRITMGVRQTDHAWKRQLNQIISKRQPDIDKVLLEYGVPLIDEQDKAITAPRTVIVPPPPEKDEPAAAPKRGVSQGFTDGAPPMGMEPGPQAPTASDAAPPAAAAPAPAPPAGAAP